jgi:hypothetical protein
VAHIRFDQQHPHQKSTTSYENPPRQPFPNIFSTSIPPKRYGRPAPIKKPQIAPAFSDVNNPHMLLRTTTFMTHPKLYVEWVNFVALRKVRKVAPTASKIARKFYKF